MKQIVIKPTLKCNFNCMTCRERRELYTSILNDNSKIMTISEWKSLK